MPLPDSLVPASVAPLPEGRAPLRAAVGGEDRLRIRVLFFIAAGCGALMLPLAAFRWSAGAPSRALFNLFLAAVCFALAAGLHRAKRLGVLGWVMAAVPFLGSVVTQLMERDTVAAWVFPCLVTYFVIFGRRTATVVAGVNLAVLGGLTAVVLRAPAVQLVVLLVSASWTVGLMIALVTEVEQKQREIERLATSDPLTGTGNRRALTEALWHARRQLARQLVSPGGGVTASFGCAELAPGEEPSEWLTRADAALYAAKGAGRNRVVSAGPRAPGGDGRAAGHPSLVAVP